MPDFDPDKFLAETGGTTAGFDPDKFLAETAPPKAKPTFLDKTGEKLADIGSGVKAFFEGPPIGENVPVLGPLAVRAGEGTRALIEGGLGDETIGQAYDRIHGENEAAKLKYAKENPGANLAKKIVGGLGAGMVPIPGAGATGLLGAGARVAGGAGLAAGDEYLRTGDAKDAGQAATSAGLIQSGLEAVPVVGRAAAPVAKPVADYLRGLGKSVQDAGAVRAVKSALGNNAKAWKSLGDSRVVPTGTEALESGMVRFGEKAGKTAERAGEIGDKAWDEGVKPVYKAATEAGHTVEGKTIAQDIMNEAAKIEAVPANMARIEQLQKEALFYENKGAMTLDEAQRIKGNYEWKNVDKKNDILGKNGNNLVNRAITKEIKDTVKRSGVPGSEAFADNYSRYGVAATIGKGAEETAQRLTKNRSPFSLTDYIAGGAAGGAAGAITGDASDSAKAGFLMAVANNIARTRGNSALAASLFKVGAALKNSPALAQKYTDVLSKAAAKGTSSLAATHYLLMKNDPEYKDVVTNQGEEAP